MLSEAEALMKSPLSVGGFSIATLMQFAMQQRQRPAKSDEWFPDEIPEIWMIHNDTNSIIAWLFHSPIVSMIIKSPLLSHHDYQFTIIILTITKSPLLSHHY